MEKAKTIQIDQCGGPYMGYEVSCKLKACTSAKDCTAPYCLDSTVRALGGGCGSGGCGGSDGGGGTPLCVYYDVCP